MRSKLHSVHFLSLILAGGALVSAAEIPVLPRNTDTPRDFPPISSTRQWKDRAATIRQQILVSCGLWPMPEKTPMDPHIFGRIEREGYTVEKVYLQTLPGFYLCGNLYRPLGRGKGPFPGVLNPHGHWSDGRMADNLEGSIAARCINFARQGMIAFSYDMVGFNDTHFADSPADQPFYKQHRLFGDDGRAQLWSLSLMGLQTWNSVRALDFLESLPDVNRKRLACTGESGGGTQTYILGAIDSRLAAQAPVVMVSHTMQGGCSCENAPGLRVEFSNMEIAAAAVPRPQMLVAATGDWTKTTLTVEGPAIHHIYEMFGAGDRMRFVRFNFNHNYNQTSREAVYQWFDQWLLDRKSTNAVPELAYRKEPTSDLRVFPDGSFPKGALTRKQLEDEMIGGARRQLQALEPTTEPRLREFRRLMRPLWERTLLLDGPGLGPSGSEPRIEASGDEFVLKAGENSAALGKLWFSGATRNHPRSVVLIVSTDEKELRSKSAALAQEAADPRNVAVACLALNPATSFPQADLFENFFTTYNRTETQIEVRNLITACRWARDYFHGARIVLDGQGRAGLWAMLASPSADALVADWDQLDPNDESALLAPDIFCPGILRLGGFQTGAILAAPRPMLIHNAGAKFNANDVRGAYKSAGASAKLKVSETRQTTEDCIRWATGL